MSSTVQTKASRKKRAEEFKKAQAAKAAAASPSTLTGPTDAGAGAGGDGVLTLSSPASVNVSIGASPRPSRPRSVLSPVRVAPLDNLATAAVSEEPLKTESMGDSKSFFPASTGGIAMSPFTDVATARLAELGFNEVVEDTPQPQSEMARVRL